MKTGTLTLAVLILAIIQPAFAGPATDLLLDAGLEKLAGRVGGPGMIPYTKLSSKGETALEKFDTQFNYSFTDREDYRSAKFLLKRDEATKTTGVMNTLRVESDGTVTRTAFKVPKSSLPAEMTIGSPEDGLTREVRPIAVSRRVTTPAGDIDVKDTFYVGELNGKPIRRTFATQTVSGDFVAAVKVPRPQGDYGAPLQNIRSLSVTLNKFMSTDAALHLTVELPANIKGDILHFKINASGTKLTVVTSEAQEVEFTINADARRKTIELMPEVNVRDLPDGLAELAASKKVFPGRGVSSKATARDLEVETAGESATAQH